MKLKVDVLMILAGLRVLLGFLVSGSRQYSAFAAEICLALTVDSGMHVCAMRV